MSLAMERFHRTSKILYQVAALYVEAKEKSCEPQYDVDMSIVGNNFDVYLSQLGFISPQPHTASGGRAPLETSGMPTSDLASTQLSDWFSGNNYIMGLMEEDILDVDVGLNQPQFPTDGQF